MGPSVIQCMESLSWALSTLRSQKSILLASFLIWLPILAGFSDRSTPHKYWKWRVCSSGYTWHQSIRLEVLDKLHDILCEVVIWPSVCIVALTKELQESRLKGKRKTACHFAATFHLFGRVVPPWMAQQFWKENTNISVLTLPVNVLICTIMGIQIHKFTHFTFLIYTHFTFKFISVMIYLRN